MIEVQEGVGHEGYSIGSIIGTVGSCQTDQEGEVSIILGNLTIQVKSVMIQVKSDMIHVKSGMIHVKSGMIQVKSCMIQIKSGSAVNFDCRDGWEGRVLEGKPRLSCPERSDLHSGAAPCADPWTEAHHIPRQHTREMAWSDWRDTDAACLSSQKPPAINHITSRPRLPAMSPCEINWTDSSHHGRGWLHPAKVARGDTTKSSS
ncbi:hypothetical protein DY000_02030236 [Brassica cretica]|uniref:Polymer-forming cytoskeletal protein n=1 Tax=Brassica cretica TaxID=69181 RepID=A0ABQ7DSG8_BRACR|nr:hypothetical protein DY000_02030236 [Brassica cretica]